MTRIALFQSTTGIDPSRSAAALIDAIGSASEGGAQMLFTPEMSGLLDRDRRRAAGQIVDENRDEVLAMVRDEAARRGIWVHLGSLAVSSASSLPARSRAESSSDPPT